MSSFFFQELQLITVLLLIFDSYMSVKHKVCVSKTVFGIFHFRSRFLLKFIFLLNKAYKLFDFKTS